MPTRPPLHRIAARPGGFVLGGLAAGMGLCAAVGALYQALGQARPGLDDGSATEMLVAALLTAGASAALLTWGRQTAGLTMRRADATVSTVGIWLLASLFGALPFMIDTHLAPHDAIFEAASGFTTTGASAVVSVEQTFSRPILLWRALMQWLGGMGIVVLFVAVFPSLGVSGKHMFRTEVPGHDSSRGLKPRIGETSWILWRIYSSLTAALILALMAAFTWAVPKTADRHWAENLFDAVCHGLATLSTGGVSTHDASIGWFNSPLVEWITLVFMLLGGVNFSLFYAAFLVGMRRPTGPLLAGLSRSARDAWRVFSGSVELRAYLAIAAIASVLLTLTLLPAHGYAPHRALHHAAFTAVSALTSTNFTLDDPASLPPGGLAVFIGLLFVGGMSGSTSGGIKVWRVALLVKNLHGQLRKSIRPQEVQVTHLGREIVSDDAMNTVATFFFIFIGCLGLGTLLVSFTDGVPVPTAFGATLTSLSNMGPAPFHHEVDSFAGFSPVAKLFFACAMVVGRLEFFTVLALLLPEIWRR